MCDFLYVTYMRVPYGTLYCLALLNDAAWLSKGLDVQLALIVSDTFSFVVFSVSSSVVLGIFIMY